MSKIRIYDLARELGKKNKDLLDVVENMGIKGKTHSSSIDDDLAGKIRNALSGRESAAKPAPRAVSPEARKPQAAQAPALHAEKPRAQARPAPEAAKTQHKPQQQAPGPEQRPGKRPEQRKEQRPSEQKKLRDGEKPRDRKKKPFAKPPVVRKPRPMAKPMIGSSAKITKDNAELLPDEIQAMKVPDRFKKDMDADKVEKFKVKPGMQKAFQAIRKIDHSKRQAQQFKPKGGGGRHMKGGGPMPQQHQQHRAPDRRQQQSAAVQRKKAIKVQEGITVKEFADLISVKASEIIKKFLGMGYMPTINQAVDIDAAMLIADSMGIKLEVEQPEDALAPEIIEDDPAKLVPRPPIVTIMGHVDHGKTSLLDAIRETRVIDSEAGGITQHIGAYKVRLKDREIVFLDTPGHEAFTALRARGASVTDVVVLIVAADDGVKPQTIEAIDHAKAAGVPIIVAINKIDKPEANVERVRTELTEHGIISEEWGGQNIFAEISAKKRIGIESILELILLQADMLELKANPDRMASGVIIESKLDKGKGPVATLLVQAGTLRIGDVFLSGVHTGRVKAMYDDLGKKIDEATMSTPVELIGFNSVPTSGDSFTVMDDEKKARQIALLRLNKQKAAPVMKKHVTLDDLFSQIKDGGIKDLNIVIKGDVQGSVEALKESLEGITHAEVQVKVIHSAVGGINESDVMLASASNAIIIGFNVRPELKASQTAEREGVDIELYNIIYEAIDDVRKALEGMLEPTIKEKQLGRAEVRNVFHASRLGTIAGCMVVDGTMSRASDGVRVIRDNIVIYEGRLGSLKRFKDDVKEVQQGYECGIMVENFNDIKVGDILENFVLEKVAGKL